MLLFALCVVSFLPDPVRFPPLLGVRIFPWYYVDLYNYCEKKVVAWHLVELKKLDPLFALSQEALRISAAYDQAEAAGIGPDDPRYPDIFGFYGINSRGKARVHSDIFARLKKKRLDEAIREYPQERVDTVMQACADALKPEKK